MPRYAPLFQFIKTIGGINDIIHTTEIVKGKLVKLAAQTGSSFWPSETARVGLISHNHNLRVWCNDMRRRDTEQLKVSFTVNIGNELEKLAVDLLQHVRTVNGCLNTYTQATRKPSAGLVELQNQRTLVRMNLFLLYTMRYFRVLESAINALPPGLGPTISTRMLHPPAAPVHMMWATATAVVRFLVDVIRKEEWRTTGEFLQTWASGHIGKPMTLDRYFIYTRSPVFRSVCDGFGYILCYLGMYWHTVL